MSLPNWAIAALWILLPETWFRKLRDRCELCLGRRGGVLGNENVVPLHGHDITVCDYCHVDLLDAKPITVKHPRVHPASEFLERYRHDTRIAHLLPAARRRLAKELYPDGKGPQYERLMRGEAPDPANVADV